MQLCFIIYRFFFVVIVLAKIWVIFPQYNPTENVSDLEYNGGLESIVVIFPTLFVRFMVNMSQFFPVKCFADKHLLCEKWLKSYLHANYDICIDVLNW